MSGFSPLEVDGQIVETQKLTRPDGRAIAYSNFGAGKDARALLYLHGSGSSRIEPIRGDAIARDFGVRIVAPDRAGYGKSDPWPGRSIADYVDDVLAVADAEEIQRFVVAGYSGGAPHALMAAALRPDRVAGAIMINTAGERHGRAWRRQPLGNRLLVHLLTREWLVQPMWKDIRTKQQKAAATGDVDAILRNTIFGEGGTYGYRTMGEETAMFYDRGWGVPLDRLAPPVLILQGMKDLNLPFARGLAELSPNISLEPIPGGHADGGTPEIWRRICTFVRDSFALKG